MAINRNESFKNLEIFSLTFCAAIAILPASRVTLTDPLRTISIIVLKAFGLEIVFFIITPGEPGVLPLK